MKFYADLPGRRAAQMLADVLSLVWIYLSVRVISAGYDRMSGYATPGQRLETAGADIQDKMTAAGQEVSGTPVVGDALRTPFETMAGTGSSIADTGRTVQDFVHQLAVGTAVVLGVVLFGLLLVRLAFRVRWIVRATSASRLASTPGGVSALALRALVNRRYRPLVAAAPALGDAWRRGDPESLRRLASLELHRLGLELTSGSRSGTGSVAGADRAR
ncbi:hypothetical protein ACWDWO_09215 [Actinopolymorpha singaporensis]|uniref:Uncharacterized protein n=1 Tax=Actinopolymorpha singaporensis TaxID=117157 RepID=A0A1H1M9R5_9ACTN|nr:hypothetical protein [Actinopolymorpha singaporensis]SDR83367.1 hypothetical protein SAMN04489717_0733 [Actinopolymorpha singaporensis]